MKWLHNADTNEWEATTEEWRMGVYQDIATPQWYGFIVRLVPPTTATRAMSATRPWRCASGARPRSPTGRRPNRNKRHRQEPTLCHIASVLQQEGEAL